MSDPARPLTMPHWERGAQPLLRLLGSRLHDLRDQSPDTFGRWIERHLRAWAVDPVFQQRLRVREIRRANPLLQELERERQAARVAYEASPGFRVIEARRRELAGGENAVAGLEHAIGRAATDAERSRLSASLDSYRETVRSLSEELSLLRGSSPEWQALHAVGARLAEVRVATGFDFEAARLAGLQRNHGRLSGRSGSTFEVSAAEAVRSEIIPDLTREQDAGALRILRGVRLGSAKAEFDYLVVRPGADPSAPVDVLAAVEAKRNPNDLAHGLRHRVENLLWFAGKEGSYDPETYRTATFPTGHFDRPAKHVEKDGGRYLFTRESFAAFTVDQPESDGGVRLPSRLYLVSRPGWLWGIGSGGMARIAHRVSSDVEFDLRDASYLAALLDWAKRLTNVIEAPDVLRSIASSKGDATRVLLLAED